MRGKEGYCVHFLEGAFGCEICFRGSSEEEGRKGIGRGVSNLFGILVCSRVAGSILSYSGHPMEDTRSSNKTNARLAGDIAISSSCIAAGLLIAKSNESYAQVDRFFCNVNDGDAHETKNNGDAEGHEVHGQ